MPTVKIIDYTGAGSADPLYAARLLAYTKNTRLEQGSETMATFGAMSENQLLVELEYISTTIRSSWEFVDVTFQIKGVTRAFTHQLVRTRTASYAQQAQRVVDMSSFAAEKPATVTAQPEASVVWDSVIRTIAQGYGAMQDVGIPNQDCRGLLPTNVHTNIVTKMNLRTLADLIGKRKNLRAQGEYADVARQMEAGVLEIWPWAEPFLNPKRLQTPALDKLLAEKLGAGSPIDHPEINKALKELDALKGTWG
jgi:flavin-dependent thymidylate synthase